MLDAPYASMLDRPRIDDGAYTRLSFTTEHDGCPINPVGGRSWRPPLNFFRSFFLFLGKSGYDFVLFFSLPSLLYSSDT